MKQVEIFTDGGLLGQPRPGRLRGSAALRALTERNISQAGGQKHSDAYEPPPDDLPPPSDVGDGDIPF